MPPVRVRQALLAAVLGCSLFPATAAADVSCSYVERAPAGLGWNALRIEADDIEDQAAIVRQGPAIRVTDDRDGTPVECAGRTPTVRNIDAILFEVEADGAGLYVSQAGGPFAPGVTREPTAEEIEIGIAAVDVALPGNVGVGGTPASDHLAVRSGWRTRVELNAKADDDPDLSFPARIVGVLLRTGDGGDFVNGSRLTRRRHSLSIYAGSGRDHLIGGMGPDFIFGRRGNDFIRARGSADEVDCGPGSDAARIDPRDRVTSCENTRSERALISWL